MLIETPTISMVFWLGKRFAREESQWLLIPQYHRGCLGQLVLNESNCMWGSSSLQASMEEIVFLLQSNLENYTSVSSAAIMEISINFEGRISWLRLLFLQSIGVRSEHRNPGYFCTCDFPYIHGRVMWISEVIHKCKWIIKCHMGFFSTLYSK